MVDKCQAGMSNDDKVKVFGINNKREKFVRFRLSSYICAIIITMKL